MKTEKVIERIRIARGALGSVIEQECGDGKRLADLEAALEKCLGEINAVSYLVEHDPTDAGAVARLGNLEDQAPLIRVAIANFSQELLDRKDDRARARSVALDSSRKAIDTFLKPQIDALVKEATAAFRPYFATAESAEAAAMRTDRIRRARAFVPNLFQSIFTDAPGGLNRIIAALDSILAGDEVLAWGDKVKLEPVSSDN